MDHVKQKIDEGPYRIVEYEEHHWYMDTVDLRKFYLDDKLVRVEEIYNQDGIYIKCVVIYNGEKSLDNNSKTYFYCKGIYQGCRLNFNRFYECDISIQPFCIRQKKNGDWTNYYVDGKPTGPSFARYDNRLTICFWNGYTI